MRNVAPVDFIALGAKCKNIKNYSGVGSTMHFQLDGKACLVTGASAGIGVGIARVMAREGVRLAIPARRQAPMEALADEIKTETGTRPMVIAADLDDAKVTVIDSLTAQKRLVEAGFGIALLPKCSVRDELRLGSLAEIDAPAVRTTVPVALIHRRKGYLNAAARALIALLDERPVRGGKRGRNPK